MLNEKLQAAINEAATLSPEAQEELAAQIESWLADARWDALLESPESDAFLDELIQEARNGPDHSLRWDDEDKECRSEITHGNPISETSCR